MFFVSVILFLITTIDAYFISFIYLFFFGGGRGTAMVHSTSYVIQNYAINFIKIHYSSDCILLNVKELRYKSNRLIFLGLFLYACTHVRESEIYSV